jgi:hypothetical protein
MAHLINSEEPHLPGRWYRSDDPEHNVGFRFFYYGCDDSFFPLLTCFAVTVFQLPQLKVRTKSNIVSDDRSRSCVDDGDEPEGNAKDDDEDGLHLWSAP